MLGLCVSVWVTVEAWFWHGVFPSYFLDRVSHGVQISLILFGQWVLRILLSVPPQWPGYRCVLTHLAFLWGCRDLNSGLYACPASAWATEPGQKRYPCLCIVIFKAHRIISIQLEVDFVLISVCGHFFLFAHNVLVLWALALGGMDKAGNRRTKEMECLMLTGLVRAW